MDISVAIPLAYQLATGTAYTGNPGDANWLKMLNYFNVVQNVWLREAGGNWESTYSPGVSAGTITATSTFAKPSGIYKLSNKAHDHVYVVEAPSGVAWVSGSNYVAGAQVVYEGYMYQAISNLTNDTVVPASAPSSWNLIQPQISKFTTVPGPQLKYYSGRRGFVADSGGQLVFSRSFLSTDLEYNGTLYVPAYKSITPFSTTPGSISVTGALSVDDPNWVLYYAAQEWAQVDVTLVQNVPSLVQKANDLMIAMLLDNQRTRTLSPETGLEGAAYGDTFGWGE